MTQLDILQQLWSYIERKWTKQNLEKKTSRFIDGMIGTIATTLKWQWTKMNMEKTLQGSPMKQLGLL